MSWFDILKADLESLFKKYVEPFMFAYDPTEGATRRHNRGAGIIVLDPSKPKTTAPRKSNIDIYRYGGREQSYSTYRPEGERPLPVKPMAKSLSPPDPKTGKNVLVLGRDVIQQAGGMEALANFIVQRLNGLGFTANKELKNEGEYEGSGIYMDKQTTVISYLPGSAIPPAPDLD